VDGMGILSTIFELCAQFPWGIFLIVFLFMKLIKKGHRAFGAAADITTFVLLFSIPQLAKNYFDVDLGVLTWIVAVVLLMLTTTLEWRMKEELKFLGVLKRTWRIVFLLYSFIYIVLWVMHLFMP